MMQTSTASERKQLIDRYVKQACAISTDLEENSNTCLNFDWFTFLLASCQTRITETKDDEDSNTTLPLWCKSKHEIHEDEMLCGAFCYLLGWAELHEREVHRLEREAVKFPTLQTKNGLSFSPTKLDKVHVNESPCKSKSVQLHETYESHNNINNNNSNHNNKKNKKANQGNATDCHNNNNNSSSSSSFNDRTNFSIIVQDVMHTPEVCRVRRAMEQQILREPKVKMTKTSPAPYNQFMRYPRRSEVKMAVMDAKNSMLEESSSSSSESSSSEEEMEEMSVGAYKDKHEYRRYHHKKQKRPCSIQENIVPLSLVKSILLDASLTVVRSCPLCMAHILFYGYWCNLREIALLNTFAELHHTSGSWVVPDNIVALSSSEAVLRLYHTSQRMIRLTLFLLDSVSEPITLSACGNNCSVYINTITSGNNSFNIPDSIDSVSSLMISKCDTSGYECNVSSPKCSTSDNDKLKSTLQMIDMPQTLLGEFLSSTLRLICQVLSACSSLKHIVCSHDTYSYCTISEINQNIRTNLLYAWLACITQPKGMHIAQLVIQNLTVVLIRLNLHEQKGSVKADGTKEKMSSFDEISELGRSHLSSITAFNDFSYSKNNTDGGDDDDRVATTTTTTTSDTTLKTTEYICLILSKLLRSVRLNTDLTVMMEYCELLCATALLTVFCDLCSVREADSNSNTTLHDEMNSKRQFFYDVTLLELLESDVEPFLVSLANSSNGTLRLRGNQLMSLYWWIRAEMKRFTLWQGHSNTSHKGKISEVNKHNAVTENGDMNHDNGKNMTSSHANAKMEEEYYKRIDEAIEAMIKDNKSAEEFASITMFSLNHAWMQQPLRHDVIIINWENAKEKRLQGDAGVVVHDIVDEDDSDNKNNTKIKLESDKEVLYSLLPNVIVKLWLTLCVTIFRPPLTDLVQISKSTDSNKETCNSFDSGNNLVSDSSSGNGDNKKKSKENLSSKARKNTISNTPSSTTNTGITTTTTQSSRASSKDSTKSTSSKRLSGNKRDLELANVVSFSIAAALPNVEDNIRSSYKNKYVKKTENHDVKRRLTLPLINENHMKSKTKNANQETSFRDRSVSIVSQSVKKENSSSVQKMSPHEPSSKRKKANSMHSAMKATDFTSLCDNDGAAFWERWSSVFALEQTNSVVAMERDVYELLSGHRILKTELSQIANAINALLPCSKTDLQHLYFNGLESCLIHNTEMHSPDFANGDGNSERSLLKHFYLSP